ncbi:MAG: immunoglobulin domain-containing protein, partial [Flavobacteriales bacterium]
EVVITWPSGTTTVLEDPEINTFHEVLEAPCQIASVEIVASGELVLCPGESVMLTAPNGYTYDWSNGTDVESITVTESGNYSVVVYDENGCAGVSNQMTVQVSQSVDPTVLVQGETEFCEGGTVDLISSSAASYDWGNGLETQSISVTESGEYQVTIVDACDNMLSSETVTVTVLAIPSTPVVDDQVTGMGSVTLDGGSATLLWYENEDDTSPVYEGASFDTPIITESTTYYVEDVNVFGGEEAMGGRFDNTGAGQYHDNSTRWQLFDAYEPFTLVSVEVFANGTADRTIELIDNLGNSVQSETVNIEDGQQTVMLNWEIEPGTDYGLRCTNNNPQLWRNGLGAMMDYPYMLGDLGAITRSTATGDNSLAYYYFFYNWTVATPTTAC